MPLPLYDNANYQLTRESTETVGEFHEQRDGRTVVGWELRVPASGPDGFPFSIILAGPSDEARGSGVRLELAGAGGGEVSGDAEVAIEVHHASGGPPVVAFHERLSSFRGIPDQYASNAALSCQVRVQAMQEDAIRFSISVPEGSALPDLQSDDTYFEIDVFKMWMNFVA